MANNDQLLSRILTGLNESQRTAVVSSPNAQLQVIAGPGTGKTKVLTSRVAYLIIKYNIRPENIIVTTFTKKAASEMKERLENMMAGSEFDLKLLLIGTFHSLCMRILKRFGYLIGVSHPRIANEKEASNILKSVISNLEPQLLEITKTKREGEENMVFCSGRKKSDEFETAIVKQKISSLKSRALTPQDYSCEDSHNRCLLLLYEAYDAKLRQLNRYDFDDLLLFTYSLLKKHRCLKMTEHVLIDEFQDTNTIQLELMRLFALQSDTNMNKVTVVGDPDQSIYGFRDAVSKNFDIMKKIYPNCEIVCLNQNYRSTSEILELSESFMRQQEDRTKKELKSNLGTSFKPVYMTGSSGDHEADLIVEEIKFLMSLGIYKYSDIAILFRAAYLSRVVEKSLVKYRIPYKVIRGKAFWERAEVQLMIDFFRSFAYDDDIQAIVRVIGAVTSGIGAKSLDSLTSFLEEKLKDGVLPFNALIGYCEGLYKPKKTIKNGKAIEQYLLDLNRLYLIYNKDPDDKDVVLELFEEIKKLKVFKTYLLEEERSSNINEVKNYLVQFDPENSDIFEQYPDEANHQSENRESFLDMFIQSVDLYLGVVEDDDVEKGQVLLSTIHASKGLEWPVVFVPCIIDGVIPSSKGCSEKGGVDEERRVFYVATTRAKHLLYLSYGPRGSMLADRSTFMTKAIESITSKYQTAVSEVENLKKLYKLSNVPIPPDAKLQGLVKQYQTMHLMRPPLRDISQTGSTVGSLLLNNGSFLRQKVEKSTPNLSPATVKFAPRAPLRTTLGTLDADETQRTKRRTLGVRRRYTGTQ